MLFRSWLAAGFATGLAAGDAAGLTTGLTTGLGAAAVVAVGAVVAAGGVGDGKAGEQPAIASVSAATARNPRLRKVVIGDGAAGSRYLPVLLTVVQVA